MTALQGDKATKIFFWEDQRERRATRGPCLWETPQQHAKVSVYKINPSVGLDFSGGDSKQKWGG